MSVGDSRLSRVYAAGVAAILGGLVLGLSVPPTRYVLDRILPAPGEGPSEKTQRNGFFGMDIYTTTTTGARYASRVAAQGDPGYRATAVLLGVGPEPRAGPRPAPRRGRCPHPVHRAR